MTSIPEQVVEELNALCEEQCGTQPVILMPFQYVSSGNDWEIKFLECSVASCDEQGELERAELKSHIRTEVLPILASLKALKL